MQDCLEDIMVATVTKAFLHYGLRCDHEEMVNTPPPPEICAWHMKWCHDNGATPLSPDQFVLLWSRAGEFVYKQKTDRTLLNLMTKRRQPLVQQGMQLKQKMNRKERRAAKKKARGR